MTALVKVSEQNKAIYRRFIQLVFNEGRLDLLAELLSPAYENREAPPGTPPGAEGVRQIVSMFRTAFPDLRVTVEDQVAEEDKVCSRLTTRGIHCGMIFGIQPTGRSIVMGGLALVRFTNGLLAESWVKNDIMGLMKQLGIRSFV